MAPGDIIVFSPARVGAARFYKVLGVFLGAEGQESLVELVSMTERPGSVPGKQTMHTTFVPEPLLRNCTVYTREAFPD